MSYLHFPSGPLAPATVRSDYCRDMSDPVGTSYRLAVVTDSYDIGGAERFLEYLTAALPPTVAVVVLGPCRRTVAAAGAQRASVDADVLPMTWPAMIRALRRHRPDVVHINLTTFTSCRPAVFAALALRLPTVLVDHAPTAGLTWKGRLLQRTVTARCAARVGVGERVSRLVERYGGLRPNSVLTIPNGVPQPAVRRPATPSRRYHPPIVGVLGRLTRTKGIDVVLRALPAVADVRLRVAGDGPERAALHDLVDELGLGDRVEFVGWLAKPARFLGELDILVVPSRVDFMPLVILEAMHTGLPVIATAVGSVMEVVIDRSTGILVPPDEPDALAAALRELIAEPALCARLGRAAARRAAAYASDTVMAASYDRLYRSALPARPS
jgi:glycosyltransferase involved in cell wall biosynthesis